VIEGRGGVVWGDLDVQEGCMRVAHHRNDGWRCMKMGWHVALGGVTEITTSEIPLHVVELYLDEPRITPYFASGDKSVSILLRVCNAFATRSGATASVHYMHISSCSVSSTETTERKSDCNAYD
jgi:hypothetical protein